MIEIRNLSKKFAGFLALNKVNLELEEGKVHGIVGPNGAGKTTFFRCLAGLEKYEGKIISEVESLREILGFLPTESWFLPRITGREYLRFVCQARNLSVPNLDESNIFDLPLDKYAQNYSSGMKKKLALLGTLLQKNQVYIFDEPFNGVDIQSNLVITEIFHQLKASGKTILIASHIFSTLKETCDQIHLFEEGKLLKTVLPNDFGKLEARMKEFSIGDRVDRLNLG